MIEASSYTRKNKNSWNLPAAGGKKYSKKIGKIQKISRKKIEKNREKIRENLRKKSGFSWPAAGENFWDLGVG